MLKLSRSLSSQPVVSLRTGGRLSIATEPVIDPHNLKILGWRCKSVGVETILLAEDVRADSQQGLAVNDESVLSSPADLVRHKEILDIHFKLVGKPVKTQRQKLGKVSDYAYDDQSMFIQQLYVEPPLTKFFGNHDTRIIGRNQVKEVTDAYILVSDSEVEAAEPETEPAEATAAEPA